MVDCILNKVVDAHYDSTADGFRCVCEPTENSAGRHFVKFFVAELFEVVAFSLRDCDYLRVVLRENKFARVDFRAVNMSLRIMARDPL